MTYFRPCSLVVGAHLCGMPTTNLNLFRERLAEACRIRGTKPDAVCKSIGLGGRKRIDLAYSGLKALDIYRLPQIADYLNVSVDWLLGRSDVMEIPTRECQA